MKFVLCLSLLVLALCLIDAKPLLKEVFERYDEEPLRVRRQQIDTWGNPMTMWSLPSFGFNHIGAWGRKKRQQIDTWGNPMTMWSLPSFGFNHIGAWGRR